MLVSVFTMAMHTILLTKLFSSNGHMCFSLHLHDASTFCFCAAFSDFLSVVFDYIFYISSATMA